MSEFFDIAYEERKKRYEDRLFYPKSSYSYSEHGHSVYVQPQNSLNFEIYDFEYFPHVSQWICRVREMLYDVSNPINNGLRLRWHLSVPS